MSSTYTYRLTVCIGSEPPKVKEIPNHTIAPSQYAVRRIVQMEKLLTPHLFEPIDITIEIEVKDGSDWKECASLSRNWDVKGDLS